MLSLDSLQCHPIIREFDHHSSEGVSVASVSTTHTSAASQENSIEETLDLWNGSIKTDLSAELQYHEVHQTATPQSQSMFRGELVKRVDEARSGSL